MTDFPREIREQIDRRKKLSRRVQKQKKEHEFQLGLDAILGEQLREESIKRVYGAADQLAREDAMRAIRAVAGRLPEFTTDDVWLEMRHHPHEPRMMGAMMRWASSNGIVERTDRTMMSSLPQNHRRPVRIWKSIR